MFVGTPSGMRPSQSFLKCLLPCKPSQNSLLFLKGFVFSTYSCKTLWFWGIHFQISTGPSPWDSPVPWVPNSPPSFSTLRDSNNVQYQDTRVHCTRYPTKPVLVRLLPPDLLSRIPGPMVRRSPRTVVGPLPTVPRLGLFTVFPVYLGVL